jgi:enoyl-CoA hydratase/carnithine racemase
MAIVEQERDGGVMVIRMNRPERLNALSTELRTALGEAWCSFRDDPEAEVAIFTGTGRAFCAGEDMKESVERGGPGLAAAKIEDPYNEGTLDKPVIAAVNGYAMGGGFMLVERADLRIASKGAIFEMSEAKRWLLGGYQHGHIANVPHAVATEMAFAYRFEADRLHQVGFLNRVVEPEDLLPTAKQMAEHLLTLPPAARVNTLVMMRSMRPRVAPELEELAGKLRNHGAKSDLMESRRAFAEKRAPQFRGWDDPADRARTPRLERDQE